MKPIYYNIILLLLLIPSICLGNEEYKIKGKYTKEKSIKKEFPVDNNATLKIDNNYGNLDITSWSENRIVMEITIKVNGNDEEKVIEKLENIDVDFENSAQLVSATTKFNQNNKSWWDKISDNWSGNNFKMEINYLVKIPINNSVNLSNDYGSIKLDKIKGNAKISCDYGQLILGELLGNDNYIGFDYTHNSTIKYMKNGRINADYSDFTLEKGEQIQLNADYTKSHITAIKDLKYNCDYGNLDIKNVNTLKGNGDYLNTDIGIVHKELVINSDYGSIDIETLSPTTKIITIRTDYTGVDIGFDPSLNFDFDIQTSYGSINLNKDITITEKSQDNSDKNYEGYHGEKYSGNTVNVTTSYGGVRLRKN